LCNVCDEFFLKKILCSDYNRLYLIIFNLDSLPLLKQSIITFFVTNLNLTNYSRNSYGFVEMYVTGKSYRFGQDKLYIFLTRINSRVDLNICLSV